ncbi:sulfite exporter TauE/SafE family protein [Rubellicoccus peritrichatus]|uniref:Probable membrane transporter protein n=1 Tax=Rubellicoccus peritrichatus TaxID=3080537 RepID=A0AAQ3QU35_9BACT|nr:sulfite exporter TauE/SafE family protein [Puniceicoccus sp. CR14]WOO39570.1 sulfite exporter TauE/SafE family protein [Puniceicoccus sp. CR14]
MDLYGLSPADWILVIVGALLIGLGKGGLPGAGNITIWIFAEVFGAKPSVGILLPVLTCADVVAILVYRRHADWHHLLRLLPPTLFGVIIGWLLFDYIPASVFSAVIGFMLLIMTALHFFRLWLLQNNNDKEDKVPHNWWFVNGTGFAGGLATMLANAAGPVASFYLMAVKLPKFAFIGTSAWFFFIVNLFKMPFQAFSGNVSFSTLKLSLTLGMIAALGAFIAPKIVQFIPQKWFSRAVWALIIFAGFRLIF